MTKFTKYIPILALIFSALILIIGWKNYQLNHEAKAVDYNKKIIVDQNNFPISSFNEDENIFDLRVRNTSKTDILYRIEIDTNIGSIQGENSKPRMFRDGHDETEIRTIGRANSGAGDSKSHTYNLNAVYEDNQRYVSATPPIYYLNISTFEANSGEVIMHSSCYYSFHLKNRKFVLYKTIINTDFETKDLQKSCYQ